MADNCWYDWLYAKILYYFGTLYRNIIGNQPKKAWNVNIGIGRFEFFLPICLADMMNNSHVLRVC